MDIDSAIKQLKNIKAKKEATKIDTTAGAFGKGLSLFKDILVGLLTDLTTLVLENVHQVKVLNFPSQKKQIKLLESINNNLLLINRGIVDIKKCLKEKNEEED